MSVMQIAITKGKGVVSLDTDNIPEDVYAEALWLGFKELLNRGMSKITKAALPDDGEREAAAMAVAAENMEKVLKSDIRFHAGGKPKKLSGEVLTEARRLAKQLVKDTIKANGGKVSHYEAKEITKAANQVLESEAGEAILAEAKANVDARHSTKVKIDIGGISVSPKLVAAAEKRKAEAKSERGGGGRKRKAGREAQA